MVHFMRKHHWSSAAEVTDQPEDLFSMIVASNVSYLKKSRAY